MENLLYYIAILLVIIWAIGFLAYSLGALIHLFLILAVIAVLLRLIRRRKQNNQPKN
ncbi:MAG: lmo0937 family membrane protein [Bacteroidota bacterium]|jgi:hypothetical protein